MGSNSVSEILAPSQSLNVRLAVAIVAILVVLIYAFRPVYSSASTKERIDDLGGLSIIHAWNFFLRQYDFIHAQFKKNGNKTFRFHILKVRLLIDQFIDFLTSQNSISTG
jgi:sterol 14-demethylase